MLLAQLLFKDKPSAADAGAIKAALEKQVGEVDFVGEKDDPAMFAVKKYKCVFKDAPNGIPPLASFTSPYEFTADNLTPLQLSQFWDVPEGEKLLESCKWTVSVFAMMGNALPYKEQAELFIAQVETALQCYPECTAIFVPVSAKLTTPEQFAESRRYPLGDRFIRLAVNARFFRIEGTKDMVVDTLGMCAFGAPEVQLHFHGLDPNDVVRYAYNLTSYQFEHEFPIENGDTLDGLGADGNISKSVRWKGQYENSLIQPVRMVLDVNCGEYAAGQR